MAEFTSLEDAYKEGLANPKDSAAIAAAFMFHTDVVMERFPGGPNDIGRQDLLDLLADIGESAARLMGADLD